MIKNKATHNYNYIDEVEKGTKEPVTFIVVQNSVNSSSVACRKMLRGYILSVKVLLQWCLTTWYYMTFMGTKSFSVNPVVVHVNCEQH